MELVRELGEAFKDIKDMRVIKNMKIKVSASKKWIEN